MENQQTTPVPPLTAKLLKPDGSIEVVAPKDGHKFTYEELLALVDCKYIEVICPPNRSGAVMVIDEEGKLNNKPINQLATASWQEGCDPFSMRADDMVVGNALLCLASQID